MARKTLAALLLFSAALVLFSAPLGTSLLPNANAISSGGQRLTPANQVFLDRMKEGLLTSQEDEPRAPCPCCAAEEDALAAAEIGLTVAYDIFNNADEDLTACQGGCE